MEKQLNAGEKIMQNKKILFGVLLVFMLVALPMLSAATTIVKPVTSTNYTGTMNVTVTTALSSAGKYKNMTCWEDPLGGTAYVYWFQITNTSAGQNWFSSPTQDISSFSEKTTYKVICGIQGDTSENSSAVTFIGIDSSAPVLTLTLDKSSISPDNTETITWSSSDATVGLTSTNITVTSPDSNRCDTQSSADASGTMVLSNSSMTGCKGTYTVLLTATDTAGNIATSTQTFRVIDAGYTGSSSSSSSTSGVTASSGSILGNAEGGISTNVIVLIIGAIAVYFIFFKKKKGK
jgi:hypothetical protein